jgi:hypothetical protein
LENGPESASFSLDLIASLLFASRERFTYEDTAERMIRLRKAVDFEMRDTTGSVLSSDDDIRSALRELFDEGVHNGWIEAVTARYSDRSRQDIPVRLKKLLTDEPLLKDKLIDILAYTGLPLGAR